MTDYRPTTDLTKNFYLHSFDASNAAPSVVGGVNRRPFLLRETVFILLRERMKNKENKAGVKCLSSHCKSGLSNYWLAGHMWSANLPQTAAVDVTNGVVWLLSFWIFFFYYSY